MLTRFLSKLESLQVRGAGASATVDVSNASTENYIEWQDLENVFRNRMKTSVIINLKHKDVKDFLSDAKKMFISQIAHILQDKNALKVNTVLALNYEIEKPSDNSVEVETKYFSEGSFEVLQSSDLNQLFKENFEHFLDDVEEAELKGSGRKLLEILHLEIQVNDYIPLQGGNSSFVEMPSWILKTHSVVNIDNFDISTLNSIADNPKCGYILEVDLDYPASLHHHHKDFPLAPVREKPPLETSKTPKLLATLDNKKNYVIHYRNLKQYCSLGMIITKVHRVLKFEQSAWLQPYIDLNTELRKQARNAFEKDLRKLFINAIYGKTLESVRTRKSIKLVQKYGGRGGARFYISKPNFHSHLIIDDLVIIEMKPTSILFDKPIYLGFSILEMSKTYMYDFHYNFIKPEYGDKVKYLYGDTDSAVYHIFSHNPYDLIRNNPDEFDTSDYPENNQYGIPLKNKEVIGIMKDENNGKIMKEFIGLRSKLYSYVIANENNSLKNRVHMRAKGVQRSTVRSHKHEVTTRTTEKIALSWQDDKRQLIDGETDTLPWGYIPVERMCLSKIY
ncbi:uncharacterized protein LOC122859838 [Aphidius gifuensis]|uniref:uncharacterized protein LOC122859838 n=1 Tax=Aphidius gifuensis TaxID=684658 RepID=UPI001CDD2ED8|nr:uncharacterized protein LOC122859838 [Aphidius gifuensis]